MSQANPNSEEKKRMVEDAVRKAMSDTPGLANAPEDDLEKLFKSFYSKVNQAKAIAGDIAQSAIISNEIHSPAGRRLTLLKMHKALLEVLRDYNREEALFLLAWTHANLMIQEYA